VIKLAVLQARMVFVALLAAPAVAWCGKCTLCDCALLVPASHRCTSHAGGHKTKESVRPLRHRHLQLLHARAMWHALPRIRAALEHVR